VSVRTPLLNTVRIKDLRPTQMSVGMREVEAKRKRWAEMGAKKRDRFLGRHMMPVLRGPKDGLYIIDHHHLSRALHEEGVSDVLVTAVADLRALGTDEFWTFVDNRGWLHPFDKKGRRRPVEDLPRSVAGLEDDPFRSLAGELRRMGGFAKDTTPFSEFLWADFLRRRIKTQLVQKDFRRALEKAMELGRSQAANHLPGWCGPIESET
jgi:hypothetical protein